MDGIVLQHPFFFGDIIITDFAGMFKYAFKNPPVQCDNSLRTEVKGRGGEDLCDIGRYFVGLLHLVIIRLTF